MKFPRRTFLHLAAGTAALPAVSRLARAQAYPTRPITMIVPFAAAGPTDVAARIISEHMSRTLGQRLVVENVVGAGGTTGSLRAMRANPDGYTIQMGHMGTHAISVSLYPNLGYKPDADFEPIGVVVQQPLLIAARKDFPAAEIKEFIAYVKANSEKLNMAHTGVGSMSFTYALLLNTTLGTKPTMIPYDARDKADHDTLWEQRSGDDCAARRTGRLLHGHDPGRWSALWAGSDQGLRIRGDKTSSDPSECADDQGGWPAEPGFIALVGFVCAEGNRETDSRQAERRPRQGAR